MGADDYIVKPFEPRELVARIRSVMRRAQRSEPDAAVESGHIYAFEGWTLDPLKRKLRDPEGVSIPISTAEFRLLCAFLDHPRAVRSEEHTSELQSLMRISYAFYCLKTK